MSFSLPLRSDNEFVLSGTEQNGITEKFMPIRSELLAMCPSVCRSAPTMYFTEFILNGTERQYRKIYAHRMWAINNHKKWAISNVSFSLPLRSDIEFVLIGTEQNSITEKFIYWAISNESLCLPFRSAPMFLPVSLRQWECISLNSSWTERSSNTERIMPIRSEQLAMCPSVCRSAPTMNLSCSERNRTALQKDLRP